MMSYLCVLAVLPACLAQAALVRTNPLRAGRDGPGDTLWTRYFTLGHGDDQANAVATDKAGNVYVAGYVAASSGKREYITLKYGPDGTLAWQDTYSMLPGFTDDAAVAIAVDPSSNVYVTGSSYLSGPPPEEYISTVRYNASGQMRWAEQYNGPYGISQAAGFTTAITLDDSGYVYVIGVDQVDSTGDSTAFLTIKYDTGFGRVIWHQTYAGDVNGKYTAVAVKTDPLRNVYVDGTAELTGSKHVATVAYDTSGQQKWATTYQYTDTTPDQAKDLAVYGESGIYTCASSATNGGMTGRPFFAVIKYDTLGNELWRAFYLTHLSSNPTSMVLDAAGNAYVGGWGTGTGHVATTHYLIEAFAASDGSHPWTNAADWSGLGATGSDQPPQGMAIDSMGRIYLGGLSQNGSVTAFSYGRVSSLGFLQFATYYVNPSGTNVLPNALAIDRANDVFMTGKYYNGTHYNALTVAWDSGGTAIAEGPASRPSATLALSAEPNPASRVVNVSYALPRAGSVALKLYDVTGTAVATLYQGNASAGAHTLSFSRLQSASRIPDGVYLLRLESDSGNTTHKLILQ
jgi:hypothetical protein